MKKMNEKVSQVILCGGFGTRIAHLEDTSKCLIQINNKPFISYVIDSVPSIYIDKIILCTGHLGAEYEDYRKAREDVKIHLSHEHSPLGTGGAVLNISPTILSNNILLMNGDSLCNFDFLEMYQNHILRRADVSVLVVRDNNRKDAGYVTLDALGKITNFSEKSTEINYGYINAGIYIIKKNLLAIENYKNHKMSLEEQLIPEWVVNRNVIGYEVDAPLIDIGTPQRLVEAKLAFDAQNGL